MVKWVMALVVLAAGADSTLAAQQAALADPGWPRAYGTADSTTIVMYQPQIQSWTDRNHVVMWSAVSWQPKGAAKPTLGTIRVEANTRVSTAARQVNFSDFQITQANFGSASREQVALIVNGIKAAVPDSDRVMSLDRVLAGVDKSTIAVKDVPGLKADAPVIFHSESPAIIVNLDGEPVWSPISGTELQFAVNTNWDLLKAPGDTLYLRNDASWYKATALKGPWKAAGKLPPAFSKLPADSNWMAARAAVPGKGGAPPTIFTSDKPAELIQLTGAPRYQPVTGTALLWVSNTESDLFRLGQSGAFYFLIAGRWFSAPALDGPWTFATPHLPPDFAKIPVDHPRSRVLASVPGTPQAIEGVLLAGIPQSARINKDELKAPTVSWQGEPKFDPIPGTSVARAVNTDKDIIKVGDLYYMCFQAVWFVGKSPTGPWLVATSVPKEIYSIPPSSPSYSVTYVTVTEYVPTSPWVTFSYYPAYTGLYVGWGVPVWGTGWYYPPYVWYGPRPIYYPYPVTYGFGAWYNPYTGWYGRGVAAYGPYGGAGAASFYNPATGTYARGATAYGPYGSRTAAQAWNPRTGTYAQTRQGSNVYGNWGSSYVQRGDNWAQSGHYTNYATGKTTSGARTSEGGSVAHRSGDGSSSTIGKTGSGDVYAGHDGNVYRKQDGQWQKYDNGSWSDASKPGGGAGGAQRPSTTTTPQAMPQNLDPDHDARLNGETRAQGQAAWQSGGQTRAGAGSYGGGFGGNYGGGGMRGGGGFRGGGRR